MKVLVIGGGKWDEREISLRSSKNVYEAARQYYNTEYYDWDGSEAWLNNNLIRFDVVLPILHGVGGEDGAIQKILEAHSIKYLGSNSQVSALCFDKSKTLQLLRENDIRVASGKMVTIDEYFSDPLASKPHVLKPFDSGSSVDTFIYKDSPVIDEDLVTAAFKRRPKMLLEEYILGTEITVPILEGKQLDIIEIIPPEGQAFDYENKYNGATKELVPPLNVSKKLQQAAQKLGEKIHRLAGCRHLSRIDMIIKDNNLYVLEINTIPGMTNQSLFPKSAALANIDFPALIQYFITLVEAS